MRGYPGLESRRTEIIPSRITIAENGEARFTFNETVPEEEPNFRSTRLSEFSRNSRVETVAVEQQIVNYFRTESNTSGKETYVFVLDGPVNSLRAA